MSAPVWLLDIDGVINANKPGWSAPPRRIHCAGFVIRWAPALIVGIRNLYQSGQVDIHWSSTWCGYPVQLAELAGRIGLDLPPAFGDRPDHLTWADLKVQAALGVLSAGKRLIWTDDDEVGAARDLFPVLAEAESAGQALLIAPRSNRGLQRDHMDQIEAFAAASSEIASGAGPRPI